MNYEAEIVHKANLQATLDKRATRGWKLVSVTPFSWRHLSRVQTRVTHYTCIFLLEVS